MSAQTRPPPLLACALLVLACWLPNCGPERADWAEQQGPITYGVPADDPIHEAVVAVSGPGYMCSGTLVAERLVLTAAHCLDLDSPARLTVAFGPDMGTGVEVAAVDFVAHPDYRPDGQRYDIGVIDLAADPPADVGPIPALPAELALRQADEGQGLTFVGFGQTETGDTGARLRFDGTLDWVCTNDEGCIFGSYMAAANTICYDTADGGPCSGDSGGPALFERDGQLYVAGVTSMGEPGCAGTSCSTKVDAYEDFVSTGGGWAQGQVCQRDSQCRSTFCSSGVCCAERCGGRCYTCAASGQEGTCLPLPEGAGCDDGNPCNGQELCTAGECQPGEPMVCQDELACTQDGCDPNSGCVFEPDPAACFDHDPCTRDRCDPAQGCTYEPAPDGGACGLAGTCQAGVCVEPKKKSGGCASTRVANSQVGLLGLVMLGWWWRRRRVHQP